MPRPKALYVIAPEWFDRVYGPAERAALDRAVDWVALPQSADSIRARSDLLREVEVIFAGWGMARMDAAFLDAAPRLRAVFHAGGTVRYSLVRAQCDDLRKCPAGVREKYWNCLVGATEVGVERCKAEAHKACGWDNDEE